MPLWQFDRARGALLLLAVLAAGVGQALFTVLDSRPRGRVAFGVAVLLTLAVALRSKGGTWTFPAFVTDLSDKRGPAWLGLTVALLGAAVSAGLVFNGGAPLPALLAWITGIIAALVASGPGFSSLRCAGGSTRLLLLALLMLALMLRLPALDTIPPDVHIDEATMALESRKVLRGEMPVLLALGWDRYPSPGFAIHSATMWLAGDSLWGFRIASVIGGIATIGLSIALARMLFGPLVAVLTGLLLTISHWHIHLSRLGLHYMDGLVTSLLSLYLLTRGVLRGDRASFAGAGVALGMCFYVYYSARLTVIIAAGIVLLALLSRRGSLRWWAHRLGWLLVGGAVTLAPLIAVYVRTPEAALARSDRVFALSPRNMEHLRSVYQLTSVPEVLRFQAQRALEMFNLAWDTAGQYGSRDALLDPITGVFFVLGAALSLARLLSFPHALLLGWLGATLAGVTMTNGAPFSPRAVNALPAVIILASLGIVALRDAWLALNPWWSRFAMGIAATMMIMVAAGINSWSYFLEYVTEGRPAGFATTAGRLLASGELQVPITILGGPEAERTIDIIRFLAPQASYQTRFAAPYEASTDVVIVDARAPDASGLVIAMGGVATEHRDTAGRWVLTLVRRSGG